METITIAKVLKPQGVKGELKLEIYIKDDNSFYKGLKTVNIGSKEYEVISCSVRQGYGYITLKGVIDRTQAEDFRNKLVIVNKDNGPQLQEGEYFTQDMLGIKVVDENGKDYGTVVDIEQYGAADVYVVHGKMGSLSFPFIKALIIDVDLQTKTLTVDSKVLSEVRVWR